jgi:hypothetical protein
LLRTRRVSSVDQGVDCWSGREDFCSFFFWVDRACLSHPLSLPHPFFITVLIRKLAFLILVCCLLPLSVAAFLLFFLSRFLPFSSIEIPPPKPTIIVLIRSIRQFYLSASVSHRLPCWSFLGFLFCFASGLNRTTYGLNVEGKVRRMKGGGRERRECGIALEEEKGRGDQKIVR